MNNKTMIQMAENKGLFGDAVSTSRTKSSKSTKKKSEKENTSQLPPPKNKKKMQLEDV